MRPLLVAPEEVIKENTALVERAIQYYESKDWDNLNKIPVMIDQDGHVLSHFGDQTWDVTHYVDVKIVSKKRASFTHLTTTPLLQEQKLLAFLGLFAVGTLRQGATIKTTTFLERNLNLTQVYKYLESIKAESICILNHPIQFARFCEYLKSLKMSGPYTAKLLFAINWVEAVRNQIPIKLLLPRTTTIKELGRQLGCPTKLESEQFYAIPSRLMQLIYSKAIEYIDNYYPIRKTLLHIHTEQQENYEIGKAVVDRKIKTGQWNWLTSCSPHYKVEICKAKPQRPTDILQSYASNIDEKGLIPLKINEFDWLYSHLLMCCFLVCGAFSGMRRSELYGLHSDSFKTLKLKDQTFYSLQSMHSKMTPAVPEKAEWLTSPITGKAIELASDLTQNMRTQLMISDNRLDNERASSIWLVQKIRGKTPNIFTGPPFVAHYKRLVEEAGAIVNEQDYEEFKLLNPNLNIHAYKQKIVIGKPWAFTTHQLRRTFAVFGKRYNLLSDVAIKQQYKHLYLPMAQWYSEGGVAAKIKHVKVDSELNNLLREVDREVTTQLLFQWYNSEDKLFGKKGLDVIKDRQNTAVKYSSWDALYAQVSAGRVSIAGTLHSYCMAGYECRMEKVVSPTNCFNCENVVIDEAKAKAWQKRHQWIVETITKMEEHTKLSQSQLSHFITQLRAAEKVMDYFEISYTPYKPEIEIRQI
ncbi:MAG: integrase [Pseudoalteromonas sp.]|nr:integrase [Pseudoalteromonas sp.]|tara:strand:- start:14191 stop:16278 length:2088 start_codon:yes stop_codon:yes gene_type:complete